MAHINKVMLSITGHDDAVCVDISPGLTEHSDLKNTAGMLMMRVAGYNG